MFDVVKFLKTSVVALFFPLALCACPALTPTQVDQLQTFNTVFCKTDAALQPIAVPLVSAVSSAAVPNAAPAVAGAVALDQTAIHPAIIAACAQAVPGSTAVAAATK